MSAFLVVAADDQTDVIVAVRASAPPQDVGGQGGSGLDGHGGGPLQLVELHLSPEIPSHDLRVADQTRGGKADVIIDLEDLLGLLVGDEVAHGGPVLGRQDHSVSVDYTYSGSTSLHVVHMNQVLQDRVKTNDME